MPKLKRSIVEKMKKIKMPKSIKIVKNKVKKIVKKYYLYILIALILLVIASVITTITIINANNKLQKAYYIDSIVGKTITKKYVKVEDRNGDIFYIPKGFRISDDMSEQTVEDGLVIIDDTKDTESAGSEFVWIPVDNESLENFEQDFVNTNDIVYKGIDLNLVKENTQAKEYIDMKNSVYKYGGFYVARYEAGVSKKMQRELQDGGFLEYDYIIKDTTEAFANGKYKPVSKKDNIVWNYISWGGTLEDTAKDTFNGNDKIAGAAKVARSMYDGNSKTSVKSSLCYASNWDAIMKFIDENYYTNSCEQTSVIVDSVGKGNHNSELQKTGSSISYYTKNICDLAGNVWELTMESFNSMYRITRGGSYATSGNIYTISGSKEVYPNDYSKEIGFRVILWLK